MQVSFDYINQQELNIVVLAFFLRTLLLAVYSRLWQANLWVLTSIVSRANPAAFGAASNVQMAMRS